MSKANTTENETLDAILRGQDPSWRGNASRYIALHTADPGDAGSAITSEATFTNYARQTVTAATGFTAGAAGSSSNTAQISFPECGVTGNTVTHVSIVTTDSGAGQILYSGELTAPRDINAGITALFAIGGLVVSED